MSKVTITITMDAKFAEKFLGFLKNLVTVNTDKKKPFSIESVVVDEDDDDEEEAPEFVAIPKDTT